MKTSLKLLVYISLICLGLQAVAEAKPVTTTTNRNYVQGRGNTRTYIRQDYPRRHEGYYHEQRTIIYNRGSQDYDCDRQPYTQHNDHYYGGYNQHYPSNNYSNYPPYYPSRNYSEHQQYYQNQNPPYYPQYSVPVIGY